MNAAFGSTFEHLTGHAPFPWQEKMYEHLLAGEWEKVACCNLPTGLGKTSVIAVWLIALANTQNKLPKRLVYVVNRRTVVDQTTEEVKKYREAIETTPELESLRNWLGGRGLALSTLRGQFADNREWSADPSRPAVICGTVDMIGSRLLFSGYGVGFRAKPLHAGFLGQDALLVHDEAHLEPAFQTLIEAIRDEQDRCKDFKPLRVMELTATSRGKVTPFGLSDEDHKNTVVKERVAARKKLHLELTQDAKKLADQLAAKALELANRNRAVLVFARTVDDVLKIAGKLPKDRVVTLTGTMRGKERDELTEQALFKRFLPGGQSDEATTYLVCTAAGEVGVNISADHLVCDLSTLDSMAQRFGRVNRFGLRNDSEIYVICSTEHKDAAYQERLERTLPLLQQLEGNGSPTALGNLDPVARQAAFAPTPTILPATDILFDAWALTSIKGKLPGRPPVEPYLHGIAEWQPPETQVAWREEVEKITGDLLDKYKPMELLEAYPLKPHELLKEPSYRAFKQFEAMAKRLAGATVPVWFVDDNGKVEVTTLKELAEKDNRDGIEGMTVLLPPSAGGLEGGMLNGTVEGRPELDVADTAERARVWSGDERFDEKTDGLHSVFTITFPGADEDAEEKMWEWFALRNEGDKSAKLPVLWDVHVNDVVNACDRILDNLSLSNDLEVALRMAAQFHDHGKDRKAFQRVLGNSDYPQVKLAKSGRKRGGRLDETYRHEFGSLLDVMTQPELKNLSEDQQDLVLHLIAAHHGRGRPHFSQEEAFDPERPQADADHLAVETPRRFARLQRKYGRWGLAYLESLLRAADWAASAAPSQYLTEGDA
ncbi:MAG TPA: type I-U CRISPR-associated helicase/endonuclease Cas3 [Gemmatales bacterium]|nr:type I-U CRISPR-associated helicase/endonuclease Cas3 [Gemmatales bacterium]